MHGVRTFSSGFFVFGGIAMEKKGLSIYAKDDALSIPQAARVIGVSRHTAYIWALSGRLPARQLAGRYVVRREDAEEVASREASLLNERRALTPA
jgi:hypothetical protein